MKDAEMKRAIQRAEERKAKSPCIMAVVLANYNTLRMQPLENICNSLGLPESYRHQVRALLQVPEELRLLGFKITNS